MLKETETEEIRRFCLIFIIGGILIGGGGLVPPWLRPCFFVFGFVYFLMKKVLKRFTSDLWGV